MTYSLASVDGVMPPSELTSKINSLLQRFLSSFELYELYLADHNDQEIVLPLQQLMDLSQEGIAELARHLRRCGQPIEGLDARNGDLLTQDKSDSALPEKIQRIIEDLVATEKLLPYIQDASPTEASESEEILRTIRLNIKARRDSWEMFMRESGFSI